MKIIDDTLDEISKCLKKSTAGKIVFYTLFIIFIMVWFSLQYGTWTEIIINPTHSVPDNTIKRDHENAGNNVASVSKTGKPASTGEAYYDKCSPDQLRAYIDNCLKCDQFNEALRITKYIQPEDDKDSEIMRIFTKAVKACNFDAAEACINQFESSSKKSEAAQIFVSEKRKNER